MTHYTILKSLKNDFNGNILQSQFFKEINDSTEITTNLISITEIEDAINITFESEPPLNEISELNTLISNHIPQKKEGIYSNTILINNNVINTNIYKKMASFIFNGTENMNVTNIKFIGYLESGTSYDVRITDITNNKIIANNNFTNINENINDLGAINNLPLKQSKFELSSKINGGSSSKAYIESISIIYN
jgi:hypothetical protein